MLVVSELRTQLLAIFEDIMGVNDCTYAPAKAILQAKCNSAADQMSQAIDAYIKSGTVTVKSTGQTLPVIPSQPADIIDLPGEGSVS